MDVRLLSKIGVTIVIVVMIIWGVRDLRHTLKFDISQLFTQLVKQAHLEQPFQTSKGIPIQVSDEMRYALQLPLTVQQIHTLKQAKDDIISKSVYCNLISHKMKGDELSGVVSVSIDIESHSRLNSYHISDAMLRITLRSTENLKSLDRKYIVSSVEQI